MSAMPRTSGFTLIELLVVLAVIAFVLSIVPPLFDRGLGGASLKASVRGIAGTLRQARSEAITRNREITFTIDVDGHRYGIGSSLGGTVPADAENFINRAAEQLGRIDIPVNNAGSAPGGVIENLTEEDWELSLGLKFMGYVRCTKHALPHMQRQGGGRIVNLIGNDGVKHSYWEIAPGAANAAGQNFTMSMAGRYGRDNISFVAVNPGPVRTERWDGLVKAMARDMNISVEEADKLAPRSIPLGRIAETEEVARDYAKRDAGDEGHDAWLNEESSSCQKLDTEGEPGVTQPAVTQQLGQLEDSL